MNRSPLGKYAQGVAAAVALAVIFAWIGAEFLVALGVANADPRAGLREVALIALGAVFGSAAAINGVKEPIDAAHTRIDRLETGTGIPTHGYQSDAMTPPGKDGPPGDA